MARSRTANPDKLANWLKRSDSAIRRGHVAHGGDVRTGKGLELVYERARPPVPITPMRTRSLTPWTDAAARRVPRARPEAAVRNMRRVQSIRASFLIGAA
jgi:hypothetical protein